MCELFKDAIGAWHSPVRLIRPTDIQHAKYLDLSASSYLVLLKEFSLASRAAVSYSQWEVKHKLLGLQVSCRHSFYKKRTTGVTSGLRFVTKHSWETRQTCRRSGERSCNVWPPVTDHSCKACKKRRKTSDYHAIERQKVVSSKLYSDV